MPSATPRRSLPSVRWWALAALVPLALSAAARADDDGPDAVLPLWRVDLVEGHRRVAVYRGERAFPVVDMSISTGGVGVLAEVGLDDLLPAPTLELFADVPLECGVEGGVLARLSAEGQGAADRVVVGGPNTAAAATAAGAPGWVEATVSATASPADSGRLSLKVHDLQPLVERVGAGVFRGDLTLVLKNPRLQGGRPVRIRQPIVLVVPGGRLISAETTSEGGPGLRLGSTPRVEVVVETVEHAGPRAPGEQAPGWWLQLGMDRGGQDLVRLPLPMPVSKPEKEGGAAGPVFLTSADGKTRAWDTADALPPGFSRGDDWKDQLVLQTVETTPVRLDLPGLAVRRETVRTYLPPCPQPGTLRGEVGWRPAGRPDATAAAAAATASGDSNTHRTLGPIAVGSGFLASTELPLAGEPFWLWAAVDYRGTAGADRLVDEAPEALSVDVQKLGGGGQPNEARDPWVLYKYATEPGVAWYRGECVVGGTGGRPDADFGTFTARLAPELPVESGAGGPVPPPLAAALAGAEANFRVLIQGGAGPPPEEAQPVKVFLGRSPIWWGLFGEPGFDDGHVNVRDEGSVTSTRAIDFFRTPVGDDPPVQVRFQGLFLDQTTEGGPAAVGARHQNDPATGPKLSVRSWTGLEREGPPDVEQRATVAEGTSMTLTPAAGGPHQYFDLHADVRGLGPAAQEQARQGVSPLLARFAITGVDAKGRPFGRMYDHRISLAVRTQVDEFWEVVDPWQLAMGGTAVLVLGWLLFRRGRKKKERAARRERERQRERDRERTNSDLDGPIDYVQGVEAPRHDGSPFDQSATADTDADVLSSGPSSTPRGQAPERPNFLDDLGPDEGHHRSDFLD